MTAPAASGDAGEDADEDAGEGAGRSGDRSADRAEAMARRLDRTAYRLGIDAPGRDRLAHAFRTAMEPRRERIEDDHHPDYLHPARTALVLMDDCRVASVDVLTIAFFAETRDRSLAVPADAVGRLSPAIAAALARLPIPAVEEDRLLESLLALPPEEAVVAAAERLDHARHLHLRDREEWSGYHATTCAAYVPVAARADDRLARRLASWCAIFGRRFLGP